MVLRLRHISGSLVVLFYGAAFLLGGVSPFDLSHCRKFSASCSLYQEYFHDREEHPLKHLLPERLSLFVVLAVWPHYTSLLLILIGVELDCLVELLSCQLLPCEIRWLALQLPSVELALIKSQLPFYFLDCHIFLYSFVFLYSSSLSQQAKPCGGRSTFQSLLFPHIVLLNFI